MSAARGEGHTATVLHDGRVLIIGGQTGNSPDLFDPETLSVSAAPALPTANPPSDHVAVLLRDGRVLVAGGRVLGSATALGAAFLFDPATNSWETVGLLSPRYASAAMLRTDGTVLVAGGNDGSGAISSSAIFDPGTKTFSTGPAMTQARMYHTITRLPDGRGLVVGGSALSSDAEVYDPAGGAGGAFAPLGLSLGPNFEDHAALLLGDGRVLIVGGLFTASGEPLSTLIFDRFLTPQIGPTLLTPRANAVAVLLATGDVLVAGGCAGTSCTRDLQSAELFDPISGQFFAVNGLPLPTRHAVGVRLRDGRVLLAGGERGTLASSSLFLFTPEPVRAYITNQFGGTVSVIDAAANATATALVATIPVGNGPHGVAADLQGARVYIANEADNTLSAIDASSVTVVATIAVQNGPFGVAVKPDGSKVYVTSRINANVAVVDTATSGVTLVPVGGVTSGVAVSPDGSKLYVARESPLPDRLLEIDTATNTVTRSIPVGNTPTGVAVSPDGTRVYVANQVDSTLSIVDVTGVTLTATTVGAGDHPYGVAVSPDGRWVYVAALDSTALSVHDAATGLIVEIFGVGVTPVGVAVRPDGLRAYVAVRDNNMVTILDDKQSVTTTALPDSAVPLTPTTIVPVGSVPYAFGRFIGVASAAAPGSADLRVTMSASPSPVLSQTDLTYTIQVTNLGPNVAEAVTLTETIPAGTTQQSLAVSQGACMTSPGPTVTGFTCVIGSLGVDQAATVTLVVRVTAVSGSVTNTVSVGGSVPDPNGANDSVTVITPIAALGAIAGKVTQTDGITAIGGATISVRNSVTGVTVATVPSSMVDGTYTVNVPPGPYRLLAVAAGFQLEYFSNAATFGAATVVNVAAGATVSNTDFTLAAGGAAISGRITELDGVTGIPAVVSIRNPANDFFLTLTANADGTYTTGAILAPGSYKVRASSTGFATTYYVATSNHLYAQLVPVALSGTASGIDIRLSSVAGGISGRVTRQDTGAPIPGIAISIFDAATGINSFSGAATDANGNYSTGIALPPGRYKIQAVLPGFATIVYNGRISVATGDPVLVANGVITSNIDLQLPAVSSITGRVTNASTSANLSGVFMQLLDYGMNNQLATTTTAPDGTYTFANLTPGAAYKVRASLAGFGTLYWNGKPMQGLADLIVPGSTPFAADFALSPGAGGISGRVFDAAAGVPIGSANINIYEGTGTNFGVSNFVISFTTDGAGNFNTGQVLPPGSYKVFARKFDSGYISTFHPAGRDLSTATPVVVTASATTGIGDLVMPRGATITGTIRDRTSGLPISGATVRVRRVSSSDFFSDFTVTTNASGVFRATGLDLQSRWLIAAQANGYVLGWYSGDANNPGTDFGTALPVSVTVSATISGVDLNLARGGAVIEGRVTRSDNGQPVVGGSISIRGPLPRATSVSLQMNADRTNGLGDFSVGSLPPGTYVVEVDRSPVANGSAHGFHPITALSRASGIGITVANGDVASVAFEVVGFSGGESPRSIRGVLRGPGGVPVRNAFVHALEPHTGNSVRTVAAFHDGSYVMDGLRPGRYIITVGPENGLAAAGYPGEPVVAASAIIDATAGDVSGIDLDLSDQHGTIAGRVTRSDNGQPIGGALVSIRNFNNNGVVGATGGTTLPDGTFEIRGVPFGPVKLRFSAPGYATAYASRTSDLGAPTLESASFGIVGTETLTDIDIRLTPGAGGVSGFVKTQEVFAPIVSTAITIVDAATGSVVTTDVTDATGFFLNDSLAPGTYRIAASDGRGARYAGQWFDGVGTREAASNVTVTASTIAPGIDFVVSEIRGTITGTAYEADGTTPLRGVGVSIFDAATGGFVRRAGVTNVAGQYEAPGLAAPGLGKTYVAQGRALGRVDQYYEEAATFEAATAVTVTASVTTPGVDFRMVAKSADVAVNLSGPTTAFSFTDYPYTIEVTNTGPDTAEEVVLKVPMNATASFRSVVVSVGSCRAPPVGATTDALECSLSGLAPAETRTITMIVRVLAAGGGNVSHTATVTSLTPDPVPGNNELTLVTAVFAAGSISGNVTQSDGLTAIGGAVVQVFNSDSGFLVAITTTLGDGTYTVFNLPPRNYKVSAQATGFALRYFNNQGSLNFGANVTVATGADTPNIDFSLPSGAGGISGRITQLDGVTGITGALVTIRDASTGNSVLSVNTDATGNYATGLVLGIQSYKVRASAAGFGTRYYVAAPSVLTAGIVAVTNATATANINVSLSSIVGGISGRVTRAGTGAPIGGAAISISDASSNGFVQGFQTDAAGNYSTGLSLAPGTYKVQVSLAGSAPIVYLGKISVATGDPVSVLASTITPNIDFVVPFLGSITGRVTDASTTAGLNGVNIQLLDYATNAFITSVNTATVGGVDGVYTFSGLTQLVPGAAFRLRASRTGYGTQYWNGKPSPGTADVVTLGSAPFVADFALAPGAGGLSGRVVDATTGAGIPNAFVSVYDGATTNFNINNFVNSVNTDGSGNFNTGQIFAPGVYKVVSGNNGLGYIQTFHVNGRDLSTATPITVTGATLTALPDLALPLGATITGTIRDRSTGLPISGASVSYQRIGSANFFSSGATTNANGVYRLTGLDLNSRQLVFVRAPGYVVGWYTGDPNQLGTDFGTARPIAVTTTAQTISNIDLNLEPGGAVIQGRITRADTGAPVLPGTAVNVRGPLPRASQVTNGVQTNGLGDFSVPNLPPGRYTVEASGVNLPNANALGLHPLGAISRPSGAPVTVGGTDVVTVTFEVPAFTGGVAPRAIRGTVRGPGGVPVPNTFVFAFEPHAQQTVRVVGAFHDGSYVIDGLPQGRYLVGVSPEHGFAAVSWPAEPATTAAEVVDVTSGDAAGIDFVLSDQHGRISGRVTRADNGQPIKGAGVGVRNFHGNAIRAATGGTTGIDGTWEIAGLTPGIYKVSVAAPGFRVGFIGLDETGAPTSESGSFVPVTAGGHTNGLDVALLPAGPPLTGTVKMQGTLAPVGETIISVRDAASGDGMFVTNVDITGTFLIESLPPGTYNVQVLDVRDGRFAAQWLGGANTREASQTVTVPATGTTPPINFVVSPVHGTISGTAYEADGTTPLRGVGITFFDRTTGGLVRTGGVTNADGQYATSGIAPGVNAYVARARELGHVEQFYQEVTTIAAATPVTVTAGVTTPGIDFKLATTSADLSVGMTATPSPVSGNADLLYTITVTNAGPDTAVSAALDVPIASNVTFQSLTVSQGECSTPPVGTSSSDVHCELGSLATGVTVTATMVLHVTGSAGNVTTTATVRSTTPDPVPANDSATVVTPITPPGSISGTVKRLDNGDPIAGAIVTVRNPDSGFTVATTTTLLDGTYTVFNLPARTYKVSAHASGFGLRYFNNQPSFNAGNLVTVVSGADTPTIAIALAAGAGGISGRITQLDGVTGIGGALVTVREASTGNLVLNLTADPSGNYATGMILSAGSYKVRVTATGFAVRYYVAANNVLSGSVVSVAASTNTPGIDVQLSAVVGGISGRVTRAGTSAPLGGVGVSIFDGSTGGFIQGFQTNVQGNYSTGMILAPGQYKVQVSLAGSGAIVYNGRLSVATGDPVIVAGGAITPNIDFEVPFLSSITGRIRDASTNADLAGVNVQLLDYSTNNFITSVNTAADGTYSFSGLSQLIPGATFRLRAAKTTYGTQYWNGKPSPGTADVITLGATPFTADFALTPNAGGISGRVVDAVSGAGVAFGFVSIYDGATTNFSINNFVNSVGTDANGFFDTTTSFGLAPGTYKVVAGNNNAGYIQTFHGNGRDLSTGMPVTVTGATTTALPDLALPIGATMTGTIRDRATNLPISGATVVVRRYASSNFFGAFTTTTNANGVFTVRGLDLDSRWLVAAQATGYVFGWYTGDPNQLGTDFGTARPVSVTATATISGFDLNLQPGGGTIQGRVTRADNGRPVLPGTSIIIRGPLPRSTTVNPGTNTDRTNGLGDFSIGGLPPGRYTVEAAGVNLPNGNAMGWFPLGSTSRQSGVGVTVGDGTVSTASFQVPIFSGGITPRSIRGVLRGPGSVPVRNAFVGALEPFAQGTVRFVGAFHDGSYVIDGLAPGRYIIVVGPEQFAASVYPAESTPSAGQVVDVTAADAVGIDFDISDQRGSISGRVTRSDNGQPIAGAGISIRNFHGNAIRVTQSTALPDGTYSVAGVPPGQHFVQVTAPGFATRWFSASGGSPTIAGASFVTVTAGTDTPNLDVALTPTGGALTGTVRKQGTLEPVVAGVVGVRDATTGATVTNISTDALGGFRTEGLAPGTYKLQAFDAREPRYASQYFNGSNTREGGQTVTVLGAGTTGGVGFLVSPSFGTISGRAFLSDGTTPLANVGIAVFDRATGGTVAGGGVTDSLGNYQTTGLAPGINAYVVRAQGLGRALEFWDHAPSRETATSVTVTATINTTGIDFALPVSSDFTGQVNYTGTKPGALQVSLFRDAAMTQLAYTVVHSEAPTDLGGGLVQWNYVFPRQPAPDTRGLHAGVYFVRAFRDSNGNGVLDANEPSGALEGTIMLGENHSLVVGAFALNDPPDNDNTPPAATPQNVIAMSGVAQSILLSGTDSETSPDNLTYTIVAAPVSGSLSITLNPRERVYTSNAGFVGTDSFTFTVTDRASDVGSCPVGCADITSAPVTVTITVGPNAGTSSDAIFVSTMVAPLSGGVPGPAQGLGDLRINENAAGALMAGSPIRIALPPGLTFAALPVVSPIVGNGATLNAPVLESGNTVLAFTLASPSTLGPASLRISAMSVVVPPGYLGDGGTTSSLSVSLFGPNPGLTSTSVAVASIVAAGGPPSVTFSGLSVASIGQGAVDEIIVIQGSNFDLNTTVTISGSDVFVDSVTLDSPSQITVRLRAAPNAALGARDITVTNANGSVTLQGVFEVTAPPTVTSTNRGPSNPLATNRQGQDITIHGTNFLPPTVSPPDIAVLFSGGDITVTAVQYIGPDEISVIVSVADGAPFGTRTVTVVNPNGGFATLVDAVTIGEESVGTAPPSKSTSATPPPPPVIGALTPNRALLGAQIVISGTGFSGTPANNIVRFTGPATAQVINATTTSLTVVVPAGAVDGNVTVTVGTAVSNPVPFIVATPTVSGVTPPSAFVGTASQVIVTGTKFVAGAIVTFSGTGVTATGAPVLTPEGALQLIVTVDPTATPGLRDVTVRNPDNGMATKQAAFEVKPQVSAALDLALMAVPIATYLPAVQSVSVTLDANGVCTAKTIVPAPVQVLATFISTTGDALAPLMVTFTLDSSAFRGTATNEDCELDPANPTKDYHFVDQASGNPVQQVTVQGNGLYQVTLFSNDLGGIATLTATATLNDGRVITGTLRIPMDSDNDTLPDTYEANPLNRDKNGVNVLDALNQDKNGNGVPDGQDRFARDGLSNFEKYRGIFRAGPMPGQSGMLTGHERLGSGMRHLFVRGWGFGGDPMMPPGFCGVNPETGEYVPDLRLCPTFQVGLAYERIGVRVFDTSAAFTPGRQFPRQSMVIAGDPTLDLATVTYDGAGCNGGEACDKISKAGSRQWNFRTLAFANYGTIDTYGATIRVFKRAVDSYFHAKPYEHRTNDPYSVVLAPDGTPMLAPLPRVGDSSNNGGDNGLVDSKEKTVNGLLAGDTFVPGRFDLALTALDVNNDACVELPTVADPTTLPRCNPNADSAPAPQATKQQVVRHLITHELGHAVGVNMHTTDATDVMYQYTTDWTRDGNFSQAAADLVQIHNKRLQ